VSLVNARLGYRFDNGRRVQRDLLNLLNAKPARSATPAAR